MALLIIGFNVEAMNPWSTLVVWSHPEVVNPFRAVDPVPASKLWSENTLKAFE
jgi:hypothetical protein